MAYPIDVEKELTGVKLDYTAYDTAYDIGAITLNNYGQVPAACKVTFRNGPEAPRVRRVNVPAGKKRRCHCQVQPTDHQTSDRLELQCRIN
ncbi:hypothetical protein PPS11_24108 [Pseudomonas putida S11]|nr:hypothetical protein PPS11_24108 [Pseudomonas putida S11]